MSFLCSHCGETYARARVRCPADGGRVVEDLSGRLIGGRYRIRELIGVGGMDSSVWKAWQTGTERTVAIKVLPPAEDAAAKRFARGARIAANLSHPNCLVIHDYGKADDDSLFLVMEFLHGQVLQHVLGDDGMAVGDTLHVVDQVLKALEHAHAQRAVHRDLKPDNLFLTQRNEDRLHVKILDFGIAKYIEEDPTEPNGGPPKDGFDEDLVTEQRQVCGTPQYMAPEQVVGGRVDARTDLYSLGIVMYRMLTGRLPFEGATRYDLYNAHLQVAPPTLAQVRPDLTFPDRLELVLMKALAKSPSQRFQNATEMRRALAELGVEGRRPRAEGTSRASRAPTAPRMTSNARRGSVSTSSPLHDRVGATGVLPDAPITRSGLKIVAAPVPSETEPNSSHDAPLPTGFLPETLPDGRGSRWRIAAVLIGAFVIGVGGVAGVMSILKSNRAPDPPVTAETDSPIEAVASPDPVGAGEVAVAEPVEGTVAALPGGEEQLGVDIEAATAGGQVAGRALATIAVPEPLVATIRVDSVPRGASVFRGEELLGETPLTAEVVPGGHTLELRKTGYTSQEVSVVADGYEDVHKTVYLAAKARPRPRPTRTPTEPTEPTEPTVRTPRSPEVKAPKDPPVTTPDRRPTVHTLEDDGPKAPRRTPAVDLLEDEDPSPSAPNKTRTPDPKKPEVDLLE